MGQNIGYLKARKTHAADECYTPAYAVLPVVEFLRRRNYSRIWCPFDDHTSQFVKVLSAYGFKVINTHLANGEDFFKLSLRRKYDAIVSNPPYSVKDRVIEKCYALNKPFMLLMPLPTLQGKFRFRYFSQGLELLVFDGRVCYFTNNRTDSTQDGNSFASAYFCRNVLPALLVFRELKQYKKMIAEEAAKSKYNKYKCTTDSKWILEKIRKQIEQYD